MKLSIKEVKDLFKSKYLTLKEAIVNFKNKTISWEYIEAKDSVHILIIDEKRNKLVLVKQPRIPIFVAYKKHFMIEACAGIVDKNKSLEEIAKDEVIEETGYKPEKIEKIGEFYSDVGKTISKKHLYVCFTKVKIGKGGGIDDEDIDLVYVDYDVNPLELDTDIVTAYLITWFQKKLIQSKIKTKKDS